MSASPVPASESTDLARELAAAAALAGLDHMTHNRLRRLLTGRSSLDAWVLTRGGMAWEALAPADRAGAGREDEPAGQLARRWARAAQRVSLADVWNSYDRAGVGIHRLGCQGYPAALASDAQAPPVLFSIGNPAVLDRPRVAVVGTRAATHYGQEVAAELGAGLAGAGVGVVSGLALGIDGAAHEGALAAVGGAPPIGVAGNGLDSVYPQAHVGLWRRVADAGVVVSEAALGAGPDAWRFPARNRIIAALAQVVVVVESHRVGGAMTTVEAAATRGVTVLAVPGSVRSPASDGTNALLADGCAPARDVSDVLVALGMEGATPDRLAERGDARVADRRPDESAGLSPAGGLGLSGLEAAVLRAVGWEPTHTETVLRRTGLDLGQAAMLLDRLAQAGRVRDCGGWWERLARGQAGAPTGP